MHRVHVRVRARARRSGKHTSPGSIGKKKTNPNPIPDSNHIGKQAPPESMGEDALEVAAVVARKWSEAV